MKNEPMTTRLYRVSGQALIMLAWTAFHASADDATTNATPNASAPPTAESLVEKATSDLQDGKPELAISEASAALELDHKNAAALDLRAAIYVQEKLFDRAERDLTTLEQLSPDPAYPYKLAQIKFMQRQFDDARPLFAALKDDPRLGDLARFHVFICDLAGGHESIAARDLAMLDTTGTQPSFYYGRIAWAVAQHQNAEANRLAAQATGKFDQNLIVHYLSAFYEARFFNPVLATFTTRDGQKFDHARVSLEADGLRASTGAGWVTLPLSQLPEDLSPFPEDLREEILLRRASNGTSLTKAVPLTFTTRSGKTYRQVRWTLEASGLLILTPDGWQTIPFSELPADLSTFPAEMRTQIARRRAEAASALTQTCTLSFTTKQGRKLEDVRAWLDDSGVLAMTTDGPVTIALADLPDDLSAFPADWRRQLEARRKSQAGDATTLATVSFTTQKGVTYHDIRAVLSVDGVMVVTPDGWTNIPLTDLPADLAAFPPSWRPLIQGWQKSASRGNIGTQVVSFDTRRGRHFDQVRASLDDKGLDVLSPDGWVEVTYDQLPVDLSPFPAAWRETIAARQKQAAQ